MPSTLTGVALASPLPALALHTLSVRVYGAFNAQFPLLTGSYNVLQVVFSPVTDGRVQTEL